MVGFGADEPWTPLGGLTNLRQLSLLVGASGDPSPLSALTMLSSLCIYSFDVEQEGLLVPSTYSSLQPISTLQQLDELKLTGEACSATSLHGLAELNRLETLRLNAPMLKSLEGVGTGLTTFVIYGALHLASLAGIEGLTALQQLKILKCGVASLQPIGQLVGGLKKLHVKYCPSVQEEVLGLPYVQPTADVSIEDSNVKEVVLAGGVRRLVGLLVPSEGGEDEEDVEVPSDPPLLEFELMVL